MDLDLEQQRRTYRLCQVGMVLSGLSMILFALDSATQGVFMGTILVVKRMPPLWMAIFESVWWDVAIKAPMNVLGLAGAYCLWGRWTQSSWQRRAGLLVVINLVKVVLWTTRHADYLDFGAPYLGHEWFVRNLTRALEWADIALLAGLAADLWTHLGSNRAAEAGLATRKMVASAAIFWMLTFCHRTAWEQGWPLVVRPMFDLSTVIFLTGVAAFRTMTILQTIVLLFGAGKVCRETVQEIDRHERSNDLLISRSESYAGQF